jgi:hypothetical protein
MADETNPVPHIDILKPAAPSARGWKTYLGGAMFILGGIALGVTGYVDWPTAFAMVSAGVTVIGLGDKARKILEALQGKVTQ